MFYCALNDFIKRLKSTKIIYIFIPVILFKVKKWLKNRCYRNEGLVLAWDFKGFFYAYQIYDQLG